MSMFVVTDTFRHRDINIVHTVLVRWSSITLLRCRCRGAKKLALAQLCQLYPTYKPNQTFPPQETAALLLNAVYFKGGWASPFKRELTSTRQFLLADVSNNNNKSSATYVETEFMFREGQVELGRQPGPSALLIISFILFLRSLFFLLSFPFLTDLFSF